MNEELHARLDAYKEGITRYHRQRKWDRYKKLCNEHELIYTTTPDYPSIAAVHPVSRSFFKLWEIVHDYAAMRQDPGLLLPSKPLRAVFLAEGPGGFVEAFCKARQLQRPHIQPAGARDALFGMSLISSNRSVPEWRLGGRELLGNAWTTLKGTDGTGDLYQLDNILDVIQVVGAGSADFVTADGGFDFTDNFNNQELLSTRLICAEIYTALNVQVVGGTFVLKVYDLRLPSTLSLLHTLTQCYAEVHVTKPMSSRPANSEKYVVCTEFKGCSDSVLTVLRESLTRQDMGLLQALRGDTWDTPKQFWRDLIAANMHYIERQVHAIQKTLNTLQTLEETVQENERRDIVHGLLNAQVATSLQWCKAYHICVNLSAVQHYSRLGQGPHAMKAPV